MAASIRRRAAVLMGVIAPFVIVSPVAARGDPAPPWGDPGLAVLALALLPISALLAVEHSHPHRPGRSKVRGRG
jgi:hypothetical protein